VARGGWHRRGPHGGAGSRMAAGGVEAVGVEKGKLQPNVRLL
jgi:hypothetical protein